MLFCPGPRTKQLNYGANDPGPSHCGRGWGRGSGRRPGGRGNRGIPHVPSPDDEKMDEIKKRIIIQEEAISVEALTNTPIPQQILEMGWDRLVAPRMDANMSIIREFYYNIKMRTYRTEGVLVRNVLVQFNPAVLNKIFRTPDFPNYYRGFPYTDEYLARMGMEVYEQLRMYPIDHKRKGKVYRLDHSELSTDLAFWNDFISHTVSPMKFYQRLPDTHRKIITAINRAEPIDLGVVMCNSLDYHLKKAKYVIFPHTITLLCKMAGIDVKNVYEDIRSSPQHLGSQTYARMANSRYSPGYLAEEADSNETSDNDTADDDDENSGGTDVVLQQILAAQQHILEKVDGYDTTLTNIESTVQEVSIKVKAIEDQLRAWPNMGEGIEHGVDNEDNQLAVNQANEENG